MKMKALVILGSRNRKGRTSRAADALVEGLAEAGGDAEVVYLAEVNIERCRQCEEDGWGRCRDEDECTIDDEFPGLVQRLRASDLVVFATPVYYSDLSESMKAFTDRLRRVSRNDRGGIRGTAAVGICMAGGGGGGAPACAAKLQTVLSGCKLDVLDMIPVRRQNLDLKLEVLRLTGRWLGARL
jgi:multimeric flavodoxin WrbA